MRPRVLGLLLILAFMVSCRGTGRHRVIVLGLDGLDPQTVDLLMSEGQMPHFARMRMDGAWGTLTAAPPLLSPVLWTTIATGKRPTEHGIGHFTAIDHASGEEIPVTSSMRRVKALWNIASDAGRTVAAVGWWATWPPQPVRGAMVSDHTCYHFLFPDGESGDAGGIIWPPELTPELTPLVRHPADVDSDELRRYITGDEDELARPFDFTDPVSQLRWALASARSYTDIGLRLWTELDPDLEMVYIEGTDSVSHLYGHLFRATGLAGELAEQQRQAGGAVEEVYRLADAIVGRFMAVMDDDTTLIVVSDHGFKLGELHDDPTRTRDLRRVSERFHRENGILYLWGARVRRHARVETAVQLDVAPTVLAILGMAPARDMPGRVLAEALELTPPERTLDTFEDGSQATPGEVPEDAVDEAIVARLRGLGYLDGGVDSPTGDRNLAAVAFSEGRYTEAAETYERLIAAAPDDAGLRTSLAGCLGALGRYDEALQALDRALELDAVNPEAYHNRAVIHERHGDPEAAVADYRQALRYAPDYEPSRRALERLTGSAATWSPATEAEREAATMAERAAALARHGAYAEAMRLLDEAEEVAPEAVIVFQYQANVAYLMGDDARAEIALVRALELEPDNALFARNLADVRARRGAADR
jgi:predicted AlkP superfamily phosphohydrolase/phosphomutase/tetratricopeptide (TPR) repeat protein